MFTRRKKFYKKADLEPAITQLGINLGIMRTNEPINRKRGDTGQADLEKNNAKSYRAAMGILRKA